MERARVGRGTTRRRVVGSSAAAGAGLLAAACSGGAGGSAAPVASSSGCKSTVDYLSPFNVGSGNGDGLVQLNQDFAAANGGCRAEMVFGGDNNAILEKLVAQVVAGTPPAAVLVPAQQTPLWITKGVIQPLTKYTQRDKVTKELFVEGYWPQMIIGGQFWRLPFQMDVNFPLFWNKRVLRAAGVNAESAPATIDDLDKFAVQLTRGQGTDLQQIGVIPWRNNSPNNALQTWAYALGGDFHSADATKITANDPKTVRALEWMIGWAKRLGSYEAAEAAVAADSNGVTGLLASGKLAFSMLTTGAVPTARTINRDLELGGGAWPGSAGVKPGEATWLSGRGVGVVQGAKDPEAAWAWVKWVSSTNDGTLAAVNRMNVVPGLKSSPGLKVLEQDPDMAAFVTALRPAKHTPPGGVLPIDIWGNGRGQLVVDALQQKRPAKDALDEVTRSAQVDLDQELARNKK
jgi:multiple sugar transport system substrate-binding protein